MKYLVMVLAGLCLSPGALAADASETPAWPGVSGELQAALTAKGDPVRGEAAFAICQGCHRKAAVGRPDGSYPRLAGQHASVLLKQMADVRAGRRLNPKMLPFADHQSLSVQEMADIAVYLQGLPVPEERGQGAGDNPAQGRDLYRKDCTRCHGADGLGDAARFYPRLNGQHFRYLLRELRMIRDGQRHNANPEMVDALRGYGEDDLSAVSDYVSRLPLTLLGR